MQFIEGKNDNRDEILANYGVGKEILGQTDNQTRANADAAFYAFMQFGALFFIEVFADTLTSDFLVAYPHEEGTVFGFPDPVPQNMEEKRQTAALLFASGALTLDGMLKMFGQEPMGMPGITDVPYLPISVSPAGQDPIEPNVPDEDADEDDEADDPLDEEDDE